MKIGYLCRCIKSYDGEKEQLKYIIENNEYIYDVLVTGINEPFTYTITHDDGITCFNESDFIKYFKPITIKEIRERKLKGIL